MTRKQLIICLLLVSGFSGPAISQQNIAEVKNESTKKELITGLEASLQLIRTTIPDCSNDSLKFIFDHSGAFYVDRPAIKFNELNSKDFHIATEYLRYNFRFCFGELSADFSIQSLGFGWVHFEDSDTPDRLKILDSLQKGFYHACLSNLKKYVKSNKTNWQSVSIVIVDRDNTNFKKRFIWGISNPDKGTVDFISSTGKKVDTRKYFRPPTILPESNM